MTSKAAALQLIEDYRWRADRLAWIVLVQACGSSIDKATIARFEAERDTKLRQLAQCAAIDDEPVLAACRQIFFGEGEDGQ